MSWEFSIGFYPGVLFGLRTYRERNKNNHVAYLPFVMLLIALWAENQTMLY